MGDQSSSMTALSRDLRERIVAFYDKTEGATYASTAAHFSVGEATVNRLLRLRRETGAIAPRPRTPKRKFKVDLDWLRRHVERFPDARMSDRVSAAKSECGVTTSLGSMWFALRAIGVTHKKKRSTPKSEIRSASTISAKPSRSSEKTGTPRSSSS